MLAAFNPETRENARKQTGSYYTPRTVVDYMVDEALVATLAQKADAFGQPTPNSWNELRLRDLFWITTSPMLSHNVRFRRGAGGHSPGHRRHQGAGPCGGVRGVPHGRAA